ncbi:protein kinase domain-containing protein [Cryptosporidium felis]|nr:protein kinase domain-containing protein [Cryptosporidium felis]
MQSNQAILKSSKSWSNPTLGSEYNRTSNSWVYRNLYSKQPKYRHSLTLLKGVPHCADLRQFYNSVACMSEKRNNGLIFHKGPTNTSNYDPKHKIRINFLVSKNDISSSNPSSTHFSIKKQNANSTENEFSSKFRSLNTEKKVLPHESELKPKGCEFCYISSNKSLKYSEIKNTPLLNTKNNQNINIPFARNNQYNGNNYRNLQIVTPQKPMSDFVYVYGKKMSSSQQRNLNGLKIGYLDAQIIENSMVKKSPGRENSSTTLNNRSIRNPSNCRLIGSNFTVNNQTRSLIYNMTSKGIRPVFNMDNTEPNEADVNLSSMEIISLLGFGSTSLVYSAFWRGTEVAVKIFGSHLNKELIKERFSQLSIRQLIQPLEIHQKDSQHYLEFRHEINMMKILRHPNIVQYMGGNTNSNPPFLICEFCSGGTLFSLLHGLSKKCSKTNNLTFSGPAVNLTLLQRIKILLDIAKGIHFLHSSNPPIIHRDIKSLNIFLTTPINFDSDIPIAKVGDFGLCQQVKLKKGSAYRSDNLVGTYQWMAPEVLTNQIYNEYVDVYSFGMIMYEVLSNRTPYFELGINVNPETLACEIIKGTRPSLNSIPNNIPLEVKNIMTRCWDQCPSNRGTMLIIINELMTVHRKLE